MASKNALIWNGIKAYLEAYTDAPSLIKYGGDSFDPPGPNSPYWIVDYIPAEPERLYYRNPLTNSALHEVIARHIIIPP